MGLIPLPDDLAELLAGEPALARAYLVGGAVRDALLGLPVKDADVEVFGTSYDDLAAALARRGRVDVVGRGFGVVKLTTAAGSTIDVSIPRRDSRVGVGHKGFAVEFDPDITPEDAARRRDFTVNAMMYDPRANRLLDFFGGQRDLDARLLRHVGPSFDEDPLRVLRGFQLAGRFGFDIAPETAALCRSIAGRYDELSGERVREEWLKWAAESRVPSAGLRFLDTTGWIEHVPELAALRGVPQEPDWHPEGDVFVHTGHCCDAMAELAEWRALDRTSRAVYMLAILCHDLGKAVTTHRAERGGRVRIVSPGHEEAGADLARRLLLRIHAPLYAVQRVLPLVSNHLAHLQMQSDRAVRRLARRLEPETIRGLALVITADVFGRPPMPKETPPGLSEMLARAEALSLQDQAPRPLLLGRHLLELGIAPGPQMGELLRRAFDAQLEGRFSDLPGALEWVRRHR